MWDARNCARTSNVYWCIFLFRFESYKNNLSFVRFISARTYIYILVHKRDAILCGMEIATIVTETVFGEDYGTDAEEYLCHTGCKLIEYDIWIQFINCFFLHSPSLKIYFDSPYLSFLSFRSITCETICTALSREPCSYTCINIIADLPLGLFFLCPTDREFLFHNLFTHPKLGRRKFVINPDLSFRDESTHACIYAARRR